MNSTPMFRKTQMREFSAHHMLLHAAALEIDDASELESGRFSRCLAAMVLSALAVEALVNAVGKRVVADWPMFERMRPHEKLDLLVKKLSIQRDAAAEPWTTVTYIGGFRDDIAHAKPQAITSEQVLPEIALGNATFRRPKSKLEREITLGNARRVLSAVQSLKGILADALPVDKRFGIYVDMSSSSTSSA